jgi:hypothetical protein
MLCMCNDDVSDGMVSENGRSHTLKIDDAFHSSKVR